MWLGFSDIWLCATYLLAIVLNLAGASARLAQVHLSSNTLEWDTLNELKRFVFTFPIDASRKRQLRDLRRPNRFCCLNSTGL